MKLLQNIVKFLLIAVTTVSVIMIAIAGMVIAASGTIPNWRTRESGRPVQPDCRLTRAHVLFHSPILRMAPQLIPPFRPFLLVVIFFLAGMESATVFADQIADPIKTDVHESSSTAANRETRKEFVKYTGILAVVLVMVVSPH